MSKNIIVILIVVLSFIIACNREHKKINNQSIDNVMNTDKKNKTILINARLIESEEFFIDSIIDKIEIIPLQLNTESILSRIEKLVNFDNRYFIKDDQKKDIFCFNHKGKFLYKINKYGKGQDEYNEITDFFIEDSLLYILDSKQKNILVYSIDENSSIIKRFNLRKLNIPVYSFSKYSADTFLMSGPHIGVGNYIDRYNLRLIDKSGNILSQHLSFNHFWDNFTTTIISFTKYKDKYYLPDEITHSYIEINPNTKSLSTKYSFNFYDHNIIEKKLPDIKLVGVNLGEMKKNAQKKINFINESNMIIGPTKIIETDNYILFETYLRGEKKYGIMCKSTSNVVFYEKYRSISLLTNINLNDFIGIGTDEGFIIILYPSMYLQVLKKQKEKNPQEFEKKLVRDKGLKMLYNKFNIDSNPLLLKIYFKEF